MKRYLAVSSIVAASGSAHAYRPFEGTDADVAAVGEIELELGPLQATRGAGETIYMPGAVFNYGFAHGYELVVDLDGFISSDKIRAGSYLRSDVLVKHVLREGSLQGSTGPSLAIEAGFLLPTRGVDEAGGTLGVIVSQHWDAITTHLTLEAAYEHDRETVAMASAIVEGPSDWLVRPVTEVVVDHAGGGDGESVLAGAIWNVRDSLSFDGAFVVEHESTVTMFEVRLGLTWAIAI